MQAKDREIAETQQQLGEKEQQIQEMRQRVSLVCGIVCCD